MKFFDKVFGVDVKKIVTELDEKPLEYGQYQYIGGHKAYPEPKWSLIFFYNDRFVINVYDLTIPYDKIKNVSNISKRKRHEDWLSLGIVGFVAWKRNAIYTLVEYFDGQDDQKVVIDFHHNANYVQGLIYKKMLECRRKSE